MMKKGRHARSGRAGKAGKTGKPGWASRKWRGVRPDRNPLRRGSDRVEAIVFGGLLVAAAVGAPVAATAGGQWAYASAQQAARVQREISHQVPAVVLALPAKVPGGYSVTATIPAQAQWTAPDGAVRTGEITVPADSVKGKDLTIWTDWAGTVMNPPLTPTQIADQRTFGTVVGTLLTLVTIAVAAGFTRLFMNRRRMAAWDADWEVTAPIWTRQR
jgi:hypothetical protein